MTLDVDLIPPTTKPVSEISSGTLMISKTGGYIALITGPGPLNQYCAAGVILCDPFGRCKHLVIGAHYDHLTPFDNLDFWNGKVTLSNMKED